MLTVVTIIFALVQLSITDPNVVPAVANVPSDTPAGSSRPTQSGSTSTAIANAYGGGNAFANATAIAGPSIQFPPDGQPRQVPVTAPENSVEIPFPDEEGRVIFNVSPPEGDETIAAFDTFGSLHCEPSAASPSVEDLTNLYNQLKQKTPKKMCEQTNLTKCKCTSFAEEGGAKVTMTAPPLYSLPCTFLPAAVKLVRDNCRTSDNKLAGGYFDMGKTVPSTHIAVH